MVTVRAPSGYTFLIAIDKDGTVDKLKSDIKRDFELPVHYQNLAIGNSPLQGCKRLSEYEIGPKTVIDIIGPLPDGFQFPSQRRIQVNVDTGDERLLSVDLREVFISIPDGRTLRRPVQGTAGDLKESLADELKISPNLTTLSASGLTLKDGKIHNEAQTEYWFQRLTYLLKKNLCKTLPLPWGANSSS